jgi:hypothetical protein
MDKCCDYFVPHLREYSQSIELFHSTFGIYALNILTAAVGGKLDIPLLAEAL